MAIRKSTVANTTVVRTKSSPWWRASVPAVNTADARRSSRPARSQPRLWYCGMKLGPGGASGFVRPLARIQAVSSVLPSVRACSHAAKLDESNRRCCPPSVHSRFAWARIRAEAAYPRALTPSHLAAW
jgi:hypothetical protein